MPETDGTIEYHNARLTDTGEPAEKLVGPFQQPSKREIKRIRRRLDSSRKAVLKAYNRNLSNRHILTLAAVIKDIDSARRHLDDDTIHENSRQ